MHSNEIIALVKLKYKQGDSLSKIEKELKINRSSLHYMVKNVYTRTKKKRGTKQKITKKDRTKMKRLAETIRSAGEKVTTKKIVNEMELNVSLSTAQRQLRRINYSWKTSESCIILSKKHRLDRERICRQWVKDRLDYKCVVFTDEKKFNLDGPDNWMTWTRAGHRVKRNKRQAGGGSIMIWGMVFSDGDLKIKKILGTQNSRKYKDMLSIFAVPYIRQKLGNDFIFQQDNCPVHTSAEIMEFFDNQGIDILEWPSRSPDLNLIENVWSDLSRIVYDGPQPKNLKELEKLIDNAVTTLNRERTDFISSLYDSMYDRCLKVISTKGSKIRY